MNKHKIKTPFHCAKVETPFSFILICAFDRIFLLLVNLIKTLLNAKQHPKLQNFSRRVLPLRPLVTVLRKLRKAKLDP